MSELLIVYLPYRESLPVSWFIWSENTSSIKDKGECNTVGDLSEIISLFPDITVYAFLPSEWTAVHQVRLPEGALRQLDKILPSLLEDELCEDIDTLHFAVINIDNNQATVVVVSNPVMEKVNVWRDDIGARCFILQPDWMSLHVGEKINVMSLPGDRYLLRSERWTGACASNAVFSILLNSLRQQRPECRQLQFNGDISPVTMQVIATLKNGGWEIEIGEGIIEQNWAEKVTDANLLVGRYSSRNNYQKYWDCWKNLGMSFLLLLGLITGERAFALWSMTNHAEQTHLAAEQEFRRVFPQQKKIVNLRAQLNTALNDVEKKSHEYELLLLLPAIGKALSSDAGSGKVELEGLRYDQKQKEIRLQLKGHEFENIEKVRARLTSIFNVEQGTLSKEDSRVTGSLTLRDGKI